MASALGCSVKGDNPPENIGSQESTPTPSTPAPPQGYDPPLKFATEGHDLPWSGARYRNDPLPFTLEGTTTWMSTREGLVGFDAVTGRTTRIGPSGAWAAATVPSPPAVTTVADRTVVLTAFPIAVDGKGTERGHHELELLAVDANTSKAAWRFRVANEAVTFVTTTGVAPTLEIVGVSGTTAVISYGPGPGDNSFVAAVDLATKSLLWSKARVTAVAVGDGNIALHEGRLGDSKLYGVRAADGQSAWSGVHTEGLLAVGPAGPHFVAVQTERFGGPEDFPLLNLATGSRATKHSMENIPVRCVDDPVTTTVVCSDAHGGTVGLDATSGRQLWALPTQTRRPINVTAVWHGLIYAKVGGEPVLLDARTGADRPQTLESAPRLVNSYIGVFTDPDAPAASPVVRRTNG
ncbi:PQQ-binding-like beta-propeller repeat protein [Streptomyces gardneri]|uniref:outer membrane protein assembly factor BamB family protein n=1 Tax=Streptomyces gardneri TaxID=66892 RepID=UPI0036CDC0BF